jgi:hypothetical protein
MQTLNDVDSPPQTVDRGDAPVRSRFRVTLECPTPLVCAELEVEAADESAAWREFCAANNISDSEHPRTIVRV